MEFAGVWKNVSEEEIKELKNEIKKIRRKSTEDLLKK